LQDVRRGDDTFGVKWGQDPSVIGEEKRIADIEKNVFEHLVGQVLSFKMSKPIVGAFRVAAS